MKAIKLALIALAFAAIPAFAADKTTKACDKCCKDKGVACKDCCKDAKAPCGVNCCKPKKKDK